METEQKTTEKAQGVADEDKGMFDTILRIVQSPMGTIASGWFIYHLYSRTQRQKAEITRLKDDLETKNLEQEILAKKLKKMKKKLKGLEHSQAAMNGGTTWQIIGGQGVQTRYTPESNPTNRTEYLK